MKKGTLSIGIAIPVTLITLTVLALIIMNQARAEPQPGLVLAHLARHEKRGAGR